MTSKEKYIVGGGIAVAALLMVTIAALPVAKPVEAPKTAGQIAPASVPISGAQSAPPSSVASAQEDSIPPLAANAKSVPDEDLQKLALIVNLANAGTDRPDKDQWARAIPMAQKLTQGPCDCEQRIWLLRYIEIGNYALSGSDAKYTQAAHFIATLGRNDEQAMAISRMRASHGN